MRFDSREIAAGWWDIFTASPHQRRMIESPRRYTLGLVGLGGGKTWAIVNAILRASLINSDCATASGDGVTCALLGRTGPDLANVLKPEFLRQREQFLQATGLDPVWKENKTHGRYRMIWGGDILCRPYDLIDTIRGLTLAAASVDELDRSRVDGEEAFGVISTRLRDPRARYKRLWVGTTPNGLQGAAALWLRQQGIEKRLTERHDTVGLVECSGWTAAHGKVCGECERCQYEGARRFYVVRASSHDNPVLDADTRRALGAGMSARRYKQEIEAVILAPTDSVFAEYDEGRHLLPWKWDPSLPYVACIDWGTTVGYYCFAQVLQNAREVAGRLLPAGSWIVAHERTMSECSRAEFRQQILSDIKMTGRDPVWAGSDRAVRDENRWLRAQLPNTECRTLKKTGEQRVEAGVHAVAWMLDPLDPMRLGTESTPLLYLSDRLHTDPTVTEGRGLRDALRFYGYERVAGVLTNIPSRSPTDPNKHPVDALRYGVYTSRDESALHGGKTLPYGSWIDEAEASRLQRAA